MHFQKYLKNIPETLVNIFLNTLLGKAKLGKEISDGKYKIPHKFLDRKI